MNKRFRIEHDAVAGHPAVFVRFEAPGPINRALADAVLTREPRLLAASPPEPVAGLDDGLTTHWQHYNVLRWPDPACAALREAVLAGSAAWMEANAEGSAQDNALIAISCWANALRGDEKLAVHNHAPAMLLGNYMVDDGGGSGGSTLYFVGEGRGYERLAPEPGRLVICAGAVRHAVERHAGPRPRISIAFDAFVRRQNPLLYLGVEGAMAGFAGPRWLTLAPLAEEITA